MVRGWDRRGKLCYCYAQLICSHVHVPARARPCTRTHAYARTHTPAHGTRSPVGWAAAAGDRGESGWFKRRGRGLRNSSTPEPPLLPQRYYVIHTDAYSIN